MGYLRDIAQYRPNVYVLCLVHAHISTAGKLDKPYCDERIFIGTYSSPKQNEKVPTNQFAQIVEQLSSILEK